MYSNDSFNARGVPDSPSSYGGGRSTYNTYDRRSASRERRGNMGGSKSHHSMGGSSNGGIKALATRSYTWFLVFRILAIIFNIVLISCAGVYLNALVMSRNAVNWLPILLIVAVSEEETLSFTVAILMHPFSFQ